MTSVRECSAKPCADMSWDETEGVQLDLVVLEPQRCQADNIAATFCRPMSEPLTPHVVRPATVVPVLAWPVVGLSDGKCCLTDDAEASLFDQDQIGRDWLLGLYVGLRANLQVVQRLVGTHGQMLGVTRGRAAHQALKLVGLVVPRLVKPDLTTAW
jgi:hypothetical protein